MFKKIFFDNFENFASKKIFLLEKKIFTFFFAYLCVLSKIKKIIFSQQLNNLKVISTLFRLFNCFDNDSWITFSQGCWITVWEWNNIRLIHEAELNTGLYSPSRRRVEYLGIQRCWVDWQYYSTSWCTWFKKREKCSKNFFRQFWKFC